MPSWAGDAISAGGSLLGGWLQSRSQNKATESQERMFNSAMKAQRRAEFEERARLAVMWEAWNARRQQLMARYGLDIPPSTNPFTEPESQLPQKYGQNLADLGGGGGGGGEWDSSQGRI